MLLVLLLETIGKRLVLPTCKVNLHTCHIVELLNLQYYLCHQFEIEELRSKGLLSDCEE